MAPLESPMPKSCRCWTDTRVLGAPQLSSLGQLCAPPAAPRRPPRLPPRPRASSGAAAARALSAERVRVAGSVRRDLEYDRLTGLVPTQLCPLIITGDLDDCDLSGNPFQCPLPECAKGSCGATCK